MGALNWMQALAALYVIAEVVLALNRMSSATAHPIRVAYVGLAGGASVALCSAFSSPNLIECSLALSVAMYLAADRRKKRERHGT